jgi:hypothetical protein
VWSKTAMQLFSGVVLLNMLQWRISLEYACVLDGTKKGASAASILGDFIDASLSYPYSLC